MKKPTASLHLRGLDKLTIRELKELDRWIQAQSHTLQDHIRGAEGRELANNYSATWRRKEDA